MSTEDEWLALRAAAGFSSWRQVAVEATKYKEAGATDIGPSTITKMVDGTRSTSRPVLDAVAKALRVEPAVVDRLHGLARTEAKPFKPHDSADLLTAEERKSINDLIRLLTLRRKRGGEGNGDAAPSKAPAPGPADQPGLRLVADKDEEPIEDSQTDESP